MKSEWHSSGTPLILLEFSSHFFSIASLDLTQGPASGHNPKETHANLRVGRILKARNKALVNHNLALSQNCEIGSGHKQNRKMIESMKNVQPYGPMSFTFAVFARGTESSGENVFLQLLQDLTIVRGPLGRILFCDGFQAG